MNMRSGEASAGQLVANALRGAWRASPAAKLAAADFETIVPLLYDSGAAGLGWWLIRESDLNNSPSGELLHQAFRLLTLQAAIHQTKIQKVFGCFREANIEPILIKGWSVARRYPQPGLRPYGDIDLLIRPEDFSIATSVVSSQALRDCRIDLHPGAFELSDRSIAELFARSKLVACDEVQVRVPGDEDHLALLAIHLLRHAAWRPLWLCDLGLMIESAATDFAWDVCLGADKRRANWILSAIGLARELLGASLSNEQIAARAVPPAWLIESVLDNWERPFTVQHEPHNHLAPIRSYIKRPRGVLADLKRRWPNPILATISVNGVFGERPRVRYQIRNCLQRAARVIWPVGIARPPAT
jgi:hypothetical protein